MPEPVEELPNIGAKLGERLRAIGISNRADLLQVGDETAFARLGATFPDEACYHTRLALAGAVRGVRHHDLDADLKAHIRRSM